MLSIEGQIIQRATRINATKHDQEEETESAWHNPTPNDIFLPIHVGAKPLPGLKRRLTQEERTGIHVYVIRSGETRSLPKEYDRAIQDVRDGIIVGGLGPYLRKIGEQIVPKLSPALDAQRAQHQQAIEEASRAAVAKAVADQAMQAAVTAVNQGSIELIKREKDAEELAPQPQKQAAKGGGPNPHTK